VRFDDPCLAEYRNVSDPVLMERHGLFVAEGRLVVSRIIESRGYTIRSVLVNEAARRALGTPLESMDGRVPVYVCQTDDFRSITGYHLHRGCLALVERPPARRAADLLRGARTAIVLEGVGNADNVGGIFRNAAAFGVDAVLFGPGCCDPLYRKAIRTSMAAVLAVPFAAAAPWPDALEVVRAAGMTVAALTPRDDGGSIDEFMRSNPERVAWLVGSESDGLSEPALAAADVRVRIPIRRSVDSLNVSVAVGIALARTTER
jgi:tRNA G18 (ribose-2'-O)-methylase SpoU